MGIVAEQIGKLDGQSGRQVLERNDRMRKEIGSVGEGDGYGRD